MNFPAKLFTDINDEVLIYASSISKFKHYTVPIEKWDMSEKAQNNRKISDESKVTWELLEDESKGLLDYGKWTLSSVVIEGAIFQYL